MIYRSFCAIAGSVGTGWKYGDRFSPQNA
jgi:hypothetical protein